MLYISVTVINQRKYKTEYNQVYGVDTAAEGNSQEDCREMWYEFQGYKTRELSKSDMVYYFQRLLMTALSIT